MESGLCALSVFPSCLIIRDDPSSVMLRHNPLFVPKDLISSVDQEFNTWKVFSPLPARNEIEETSHHICSVWCGVVSMQQLH